MKPSLLFQPRSFSARARVIFFASLLIAWFLSCGATRVFGLQTVELSWNLSTNSNIASYRVFYGTHSGIYTNSVVFTDPTLYDANNPTAIDDRIIENLPFGMNLYFAVQATDADGRNSVLTEEAVFVTSVFPPILQSRIYYENGQPFIEITGTITPGVAWQIETSTDLKTWTNLDNPYSTSPISFSTQLDDNPQRYFRVELK